MVVPPVQSKVKSYLFSGAVKVSKFIFDEGGFGFL